MIGDDDLAAAVAAGAIDADAAARLRAFVAERASIPIADDERFRLLTGFNDIFVSIAVVLVLVALAWLAGSIPTNDYGKTMLASATVAAAAWPLASVFTARRRMALPSILLLLAFVGGLFTLGLAAADAWVGDPWGRDAAQSALVVAAAAMLAALGAWAHWRRFHVPITIAAGVGAVVAFALATLILLIPALAGHAIWIVAVAGLVVFGLAMWWDMSDPERQTRRADVAFWLHLLAAPLIVHPVFKLTGLVSGPVSIAGAAAVVAIYVVLALIALATDRRALMVSALAYVLYAVSQAIRQIGALTLSGAVTALLFGSALLLLSALWVAARARVIAALPEGWRRRLPAAARLNPRRA